MNHLFQRATTHLTKPTRCVLQIVAGIGGASAAGAAFGLNLQALGNVAESAISGCLGGQFLQSTPVLAGMSGTLDLSSVTGQAAAVIVAPVALSAAVQIQSNPYAFAMAAALACSTAFLTPIAHPVNLLVMGPGGYTPRDFFKIGSPLTLVVFIVMLIVLPRVWPL